jgi:phospholipase/carboxylesterase
MSDNLQCVELSTGPEPTSAVIWLHGLGADGHDFEPIVPHLGLAGAAVRFVFPHAPTRPISLNGGLSMRAWFDLLDLDRLGKQDEEGIRHSAALVDQLIVRENARGIPDQNIVLAGFSQGGAIALHLGVRRAGPLAGIMALSTYLPLAQSLEREASEHGRQVPIFMAHGRHDPVLPLAWGVNTRDRLDSAGYRVQWRDYDMPHAVCGEEIEDIGAWLRDLLVRV